MIIIKLYKTRYIRSIVLYMYGYPPTSSLIQYKIQFLNIYDMLPNERYSKILDPASPLIQFLGLIRDGIQKYYPLDTQRPWHIELVDRLPTRKADPREETLARARKLQGLNITIRPSEFFFMGRRAFVLGLPPIIGYTKIPHITVAYLGKDADETTKSHIYQIVTDISSAVNGHGD